MSGQQLPGHESLALPQLVHAVNLLTQQGQTTAACHLYQGWIEANPTHPLLFAALFNLSVIQGDLGDVTGGIKSLQRVIEVNPDFVGAYINLGRFFERAQQADKALQIWYTGINRPLPMTGQSVIHAITALKQIARVHMDREEPEQAEQALSRCLGLSPSEDDALEQFLALRMREWRRPVLTQIEALDGKAMLKRFHPLSVAAFTDDPLLQLASAHGYVRRLLNNSGPLPRESDRRDAPIDLKGRRIRVGYLSSDLRDHAIGYLMAEFLELQERADFEVFAYFTGAAPTSAMTTRIQDAVEHWVDIRTLGDDAAAARIAADGLDILVDVNGHTRDARLGVFARRPAPIQVNWLGFPGTMASSFHHYVIADPWIIPEGSESYFSEKVLRLPCYQPNDRKRVVGEPTTRAERGLPDDKFVFCSFNALHKITAFTLDRWIAILKAVPNSVMWMLDCSAQAKRELAQRFEANGIEASRLIYAPKLANPLHLARYPLADLFLDALPYGAHTTASDALWMGVPVLTLSGRSFASRVCGSLVRSAGLPDLVVNDPQAYVARAIELANDPAALAEIKARLAAGRDSCALFDQELLVRSIGDLYRSMIADYQAGTMPEPDLRNLESYLNAGIAHDHEGVEISWVPDYEEAYRVRLAEIDRRDPLEADSRLWPHATSLLRRSGASR
ncbi:N-acetylglucosamine transferase [Phreatobacter aquaticus]|uniref:protein O-GlcNAc transferase n=1 Tax=Phreatobacter aquaticus TaxID=2570229 RepID=A0A4D7QHP7_9HYPH|nr:N-acetylglucosamine transferase [Phreatobacter aquaticus]